MKKVIIALLILAVLILSGCKNGITGGAIVCNKPYILVGDDCCLDKDDNSICDKDEVEEIIEPVEPPKEEIVEEEPVVEEVVEEVIEEEPEETEPSNEFLIKLGESIEFDKKTVTLIELDNMPLLKAVFDIEGVERDVTGTKNLEIINNVEVTLMTYNNLDNSVIVKLETLDLGDNEMITSRNDVKVLGKRIHLRDVWDSGAIMLDVTDIGTGDVNTKILIKEGKSETVQGITITNVDGFPRGVKIERYAIINVQQ